MKKNKINKIAKFVGGTVLLTALGTAAFDFGHKPDVVTNPCWRSCHLADGRCKKAFDTATQANWQSVKQQYRMLYYYNNIECEWDGCTCSSMEKLLAFAHANFGIGSNLVLYDPSFAA